MNDKLSGIDSILLLHYAKIENAVSMAIIEMADTLGLSDSEKNKIIDELGKSLLPVIQDCLNRIFINYATPKAMEDDIKIDSPRGNTGISSLPEDNAIALEILTKLPDIYKDEKVISGLMNKNLDEDIIKALLDIYCRIYNIHDDIVSDQLEKYFIQLSNFDIIINHAQLNYPAENAIHFNKVKKYYINMKLNTEEKKKLEKIEFNDNNREGIVLFELCPQIILNDKIYKYGKVIIS